MSKEVIAKVKLEIVAGQASPAPGRPGLASTAPIS
jgi:hypothetical protein